MRLCVLGHSLIDPRQALFCEELRKQCLDVLEIYPSKWGVQTREGGCTLNEGNNIRDYYFLRDYHFREDAWDRIRKFKPDIIYSMTEIWQLQGAVSYHWSKLIEAGLIYFVWENIHPVTVPSDVTVIAGNGEAAALHHTDYILPQVGIDPDLFKPADQDKEYDFVFMGRDSPEKGTHIIEEALEGIDASILWRKDFLEYDKVPEFLNRAGTHLAPSIDTKYWKEQAGNYANLEALFCGLSVITSDSAAIVEWLEGCPAVKFVPQKDVESLREAMVNPPKIVRGSREWVMKRYSNEVVAGKLIKIMEEVM